MEVETEIYSCAHINNATMRIMLMSSMRAQHVQAEAVAVKQNWLISVKADNSCKLRMSGIIALSVCLRRCVCVEVKSRSILVCMFVCMCWLTHMWRLCSYIYVYILYGSNSLNGRRHAWRIRNLKWQTWLAFNEARHTIVIAFLLLAALHAGMRHDITGFYFYYLPYKYSINSICWTHTFIPQPAPLLLVAVVLLWHFVATATIAGIVVRCWQHNMCCCCFVENCSVFAQNYIDPRTHTNTYVYTQTY